MPELKDQEYLPSQKSPKIARALFASWSRVKVNIKQVKHLIEEKD